VNPRAEGAFEAVSYIREFMRKYRDRDRFAHMLEDEFESLIDDIASGVVDFRARMRPPS